MATAGPGCRPLGPSVRLPDELREASGAAVSLRHPGVFWTHADGARSDLFAVDDAGRLLARFPIEPHTRDWEDLSLATCPDGGSCLYLADTGDNYEERGSVRILRVAEPDPGNPTTLHPEVFPVRYPDGPRDAEALLVLPGERVLVVTKGRNDAVTVYRYPGALRPDTVVLEEVQRLSDDARFLPRQVTGGSVSPDGALAAIRTYESLRFYDVRSDSLVPVDGGLVNLHTLDEAQGEGVGLGPDGQVVLTSEGGPLGGPASLSMLRCRLGGLWTGDR